MSVEDTFEEDLKNLSIRRKPPMLKININDYVWVKLTQKGRERLAQDEREHREVAALYECTFTPPKEQNGYTQLQLWELMRIFGASMFNGCELSFETNILIGEDP